jgi:hypothetical protein
MAHARTRAWVVLVIAAMTVAAVAGPSPAGAATQTCPTPKVATVPCVIAVQNNTSSGTLTATPTRLVATTVATGRYAIVATVVVSNSAGTGEPLPFATCTLKAGSTVLDEIVAYTLDQATTVTLVAARNLTAATKLSVWCADPTGFGSLDADYTRLQATHLGTLLRPAEGTTATQTCPKASVTSIPCAIHVQTKTPTVIGATETSVAAVNLAPGSYTMRGRVEFGRSSSSSANVECTSDNGVIGLSTGRQFVLQNKTAELTLGTAFSNGGTQTVEVTCRLLDGAQAIVDSVRLTLVRMAQLDASASCPGRRLSTVPCSITADGGGPLTSTHSTYVDANVAAGTYSVSAAVSVQSDDPAGGFHFVDCALVSGAGEFGAGFEVVAGQGGTLFMIDTHVATAAGDLTVSCADDSNSGQLSVAVKLVATELGTLISKGT